METFEDVITHYTNRLRIASEMEADLKKLLKEMQAIASVSWEGRASEVLRDRLEELIKRENGVTEDLSDALLALGSMEEVIEIPPQIIL